VAKKQEAPSEAENRAMKQAREDCGRCNRSGWLSVEGPYGTSAAYPCSHKPESEQDRRMGVRVPASLESHYKRESIEAEERQKTWAVNRKNPLNQPVPPQKKRTEPKGWTD
jgi:hypothetical protein